MLTTNSLPDATGRPTMISKGGAHGATAYLLFGILYLGIYFATTMAYDYGFIDVPESTWDLAMQLGAIGIVTFLIMVIIVRNLKNQGRDRTFAGFPRPKAAVAEVN